MTTMATPKLSKTQAEALAKIRAAGAWHARDGISSPTIAALERAGLVDVEWSTETWTNYRTRRTHYRRDWIATAR